MIDELIADFTLNKEQALAFRLVASHSMGDGKQPLSLFLGGAAGTGKSQVIKALMAFFQ